MTNKTGHIEWHGTCECKCRLDTSVCNNKQCRECDKRRCEKRFIWNSSICDCECDKLCEGRQYLDYENCKCRRETIDELVEK